MMKPAKISYGFMPGDPDSTAQPYDLTVCLLGHYEIALPSEFILEVTPSPSLYQQFNLHHASWAGIMDLRGLQLPTFRLDRLLALPFAPATALQRVLVCRLLGFRAGLLVDTILENISIPPENVLPAPAPLAQSFCITKVAHLGGKHHLLPILEMGPLTNHLQQFLNLLRL